MLHIDPHIIFIYLITVVENLWISHGGLRSSQNSCSVSIIKFLLIKYLSFSLHIYLSIKLPIFLSNYIYLFICLSIFLVIFFHFCINLFILMIICLYTIWLLLPQDPCLIANQTNYAPYDRLKAIDGFIKWENPSDVDDNSKDETGAMLGYVRIYIFFSS